MRHSLASAVAISATMQPKDQMSVGVAYLRTKESSKGKDWEFLKCPTKQGKGYTIPCRLHSNVAGESTFCAPEGSLVLCTKASPPATRPYDGHAICSTHSLHSLLANDQSACQQNGYLADSCVGTIIGLGRPHECKLAKEPGARRRHYSSASILSGRVQFHGTALQ